MREKSSHSPLPVLLLVLLQAPAFGDPLRDLAGEALRGRLLAGETLSEVQLKSPAFKLLPAHAGLRALAGEIKEELAPGILAETLGLYKKPFDVSGRAWTVPERTALLNCALGISTLAGIEYYSASRKTMRTFYEKSAVVAGPESKKPLPDPVAGNETESLTLYALQKDLTFGENLYRYDYWVFPDALAFVQENLTLMAAGIIPAVGKNKLRSLVAVLDAGDYLLIYAASMAKTVAIPGMSGRIGDSFSNRALAIFKWYEARADKALGG